MSGEHGGSEPLLPSPGDDNRPDPSPPGEPQPDAGARREELLAKGKRYREAHREERAAAQAEWKRNNRERARELNRLSMRRAAQRRKTASAKAEWHQRYYEKHAEHLRAYSREYLAKRREADPEAYWEWRRASQRAWYQRHKDEALAKSRERAREDPAEKRDYANAYYRQHTEQVKARRREYYQDNKDKITARQKEWIEKDKRRKAAGLPKRHLHRTPRAERQANQRAADEFFGRPVDRARLVGLRAELGTPDELLRRFQRDSWRARAVDYAHRNPETRSTVLDRRSSEERRLDEIARVINERLRYREPPRQPHHLDPTTPPPPTWSSPGGGLSR